jgi:hypothetical protein
MRAASLTPDIALGLGTDRGEKLLGLLGDGGCGAFPAHRLERAIGVGLLLDECAMCGAQLLLQSGIDRMQPGDDAILVDVGGLLRQGRDPETVTRPDEPGFDLRQLLREPPPLAHALLDQGQLLGGVASGLTTELGEHLRGRDRGGVRLAHLLLGPSRLFEQLVESAFALALLAETRGQERDGLLERSLQQIGRKSGEALARLRAETRGVAVDALDARPHGERRLDLLECIGNRLEVIRHLARGSLGGESELGHQCRPVGLPVLERRLCILELAA